MIGIGAGIGISRMRDLAALIRNMLFGSGEVGAMYDLSDLTTQFQDATGTTSITANGQVEGLWLDKSKGLVLGSELATNGGFDSDTGWTKGVGCTISDGNAVFTEATGNFSQPIAGITAGYYEFTVVVASVTAGSFGIELGDGAGHNVNITGAGTYTFRWYWSGIDNTLYLHAHTTPVSAVVASVSLKHIPGNHATQATTASKPLSATNSADFDGLDDKMAQAAGGGSTTAFMLCAGIVIDAVGAVQTIWSDTGTNTGYAVRINASNQLEILAGNGTAYTTCATTDTVSSSTPFVATVWDDGTNLNAQINNGTVVSVARPVVAAGTSTATIGSSNAATANVLNGKVYQLVQVKNDAGTEAEREAAKAYVASKTGVTL